MADGSIIIDTEIDSSGAESDVKSLSSKLGSMASNALGAVTKITAAMVTAATGAVAALTKLSVEQYAEYEQLTGGVETLFKNSSDKVMEYANNAYESAGMSANEYMSTITGFAASLLQGLGGDTEKAAQIGNMAVTDMSDNANKMGTAIERIQDAYQGFAKQNYTMLDNLKLGYGGTKTEMERLLADAQKISGVKYDISNFNDVIEAIHVIQEQMGITGTTSLEAASTIEGSLNMTKSAWKNLLTGMADENINFEGLVKNLVDSLGSLAENLLPRIKTAIEGVGKLIRTLLPKVLDEIPDIVSSLFPESMQEDVKTIFDGIVEAIKTTVDVAIQLLPKITEGFAWFIDNSSAIVGGILAISAAIVGFKAGAIITNVIKSWQEAQLALALYGMSAEGVTIKQGVMNGVFTAWETLVALFTGKITLATVATNLWAKAQGILNGILSANPIGLVIAGVAALVAGIIYLWNTNDGFREAIINAWNSIKEVGEAVWGWLVRFFTEDIPNAWNALVIFFQGIPDWFGELWGRVTDKFKEWGEGIKSFFSETIPALIQQIFDWFNELPDKIGYALGYALASIVKWGIDTWNYLITNVPIWIENVATFFSELPGKIWTYLVDSYNNIVNWGTDIWSKSVEIGANFINNIVNWFMELPGKISTWLTNTMSKVSEFASNLGQRALEAGNNMVYNIVNVVRNLPSQMVDIGRNIVEGVWNGISSMGSWIADKVSGFFGGILDGAKKALGIHSPSRVFRDEVGKYIAQGVGVGFEDEFDSVENSIYSQFDTFIDGINLDAIVDVNSSSMGRSVTTGTGITNNYSSVDKSSSSNSSITQNINIVNPKSTAYENARELRKIERDLGYAL